MGGWVSSRTHLSYYLLSIAFGLFYGSPIFGQAILPPSLSDTTVISADILDFVQVQHLLPTPLPTQPAVIEELHSSLHSLKQAKVLATQIGLSQYLFWGDTLHSHGIPSQWYSQIYGHTNLQLGNLPLRLGGQLVAIDGQLDGRLSSFSFGFDAAAWQERMREKYLLPNDWKEVQQALNLSPNELKTLEEQFQFDIYRQIVSHPRFAELKATAQNQLDSLVAAQLDRVTLEKWQKTLHTIQKIEQRYQQLWDIRQQLSPDETLRAIEAKAERLKQQWLALAQPDSLRQKLLNNDSLRLKEKCLSMTKAFEVGQFNLHDNEYTAQHLPLNGIHYSFTSKHLYGEIGWGNQALNSQFLPNLGALLLSRYQGQRFFFLKAGIGKQSHHNGSISLLRAKAHTSPKDSSFVFPKENLVIATSGAMALTKDLRLETDIALSEHDLIQLAPSDAPASIPTTEKLAFEWRSVYQTKEEQLKVGLGYFYVGTAFTTLGNPFLLTGRQGLRLDLRTQLWERKLSIHLSGKYGWNTNGTLSSNEFEHLQLRGELRWQWGRSQQILLRMMPNTFQQYQSEQVAASAQNTIYSVQGIFFSSIGQTPTLLHYSSKQFRQQFQISRYPKYWQSTISIPARRFATNPKPIHSSKIAIGWSKAIKD